MANTKLTFLGTERSGTDQTELQAHVNTYNEIFLEISSGEDIYDTQHICLDRKTAIVLSKALKNQISKLSDNG